jgi:hypothetical protein
MQTLKQVATTYNTATMREAHATARLLVFLYQQRRWRDAKLLGSVLDADNQQDPGSCSAQSLPESQHLEEVALLEGLVADMPSLQGFDFDQFLDMDMLRAVSGVDNTL